jgi:hypothetical protein
MQAIKLKARVGADRRISVELPPEVPETDVEVIVLVPGPETDRENEQRRALEALFRKLDAGGRPRLSKEEIDRYLEGERASWER